MAQNIMEENNSTNASPIIEADVFPSSRQQALDAEERKRGNAVAYVLFPNGHAERVVMAKGTTKSGRADFDCMLNPYNPKGHQVIDGKFSYGGRLQLWRAF